MKSWDSLYFPSNDSASIVSIIQESLTSLGFTLFNPFGLIAGKVYRHTVRMFVAQAGSGWVRVIGTPDQRQFVHFTHTDMCLHTALDEAGSRITVYAHGVPVDPAPALAPYLREDCSLQVLTEILQRARITILPPVGSPSTTPFDVLPADLQALSAKVDLSQAQSMFENLTGGLMSKLSQSTGDTVHDKNAAARNLLAEQAVLDWNSPGGQHIRSVMACLTIPSNWQQPDFEALRDAYPLHERRRRKPDARLYPGDAEAMALVPDALTYTPVYGGID